MHATQKMGKKIIASTQNPESNGHFGIIFLTQFSILN